MPIYNVIQKNDLYNNAIFVVRYFGGIKLGIGGLIRAYSHTALETIKSGTRHSVVKSAEYTVEIKYDYLNIMLRTLPSQNLKITEKIFEENVLLRIVSDKSYIDQIKKNPSVLKLSVIKDSFYCTF